MAEDFLPLPPDLVKQATYRRNGLEVFGHVDLARTALLVMNMQNAWLAPGAPFRVGSPELFDGLLERIAAFAHLVRAGGGQVAWFRTTVGAPGTVQYWSTYYDNFIEPGKRAVAVAALTPGHPMFENAGQITGSPSSAAYAAAAARLAGPWAGPPPAPSG